MSYYGRGDYYRGDYYRGDFFSNLKKNVEGIGKVVGGFIAGGPAGAAAGAVSLMGAGGGGPPRAPGTAIVGPIHTASTTPVIGGLVNVGRRMLGETVIDPSQGVPRGYHVSKKTGNIVRNRHMNPLNVKALRRADRRANSFLRITRSVVKHYVAKAPKGKGYVHFKRKK